MEAFIEIAVPLIVGILVVYFILNTINKRIQRKSRISPKQRAESRKWAITWICAIIGIACAFTGILIPITFAMGATIKAVWRHMD